VDRAAFELFCKDHPEWLVPIQQDVVDTIQKHWSLARCLFMQIHCKVGAQEKFQHLINLLAKVYNKEAKKWIRKELYQDSGVYIPLLKSKNAVSAYGKSILLENPVIQDEEGTAVWIDLDRLLEETILDDRKDGYLQSRVHLDEDTVWLHWGEDAAG
jgi:hypothetical protein